MQIMGVGLPVKLFAKLFKKNKDVEKDELSYDELELLWELRNSELSDWHRSRYKNADVTFKKFLKHGYIRESNDCDMINKYYKVSDLKPILAANSIKTGKMRKADMIEALLNQLPSSEVEKAICKCTKFHLLTDKGKQSVNKYREDKAIAERREFDELADMICKQDYKKISGYFQKLVDTTNLYDDFESTEEDLVATAFIFKCSCNDLPVDTKMRDKLASLICAHNLTGYYVIDIFVDECINIRGFEFPKDVKKYITYDVDDEDLRDQLEAEAELYIRTYLFKLSNYQHLMDYQKNPYCVGVEVDVPDEDECTCKLCAKQAGKRYNKFKAPILPLHWGCRCSYKPIYKYK